VQHRALSALASALLLAVVPLTGCVGASVADRVSLVAQAPAPGATLVVAANDAQVAFLPLDEAIQGVLSRHGIDSLTLAMGGEQSTLQPPMLVTFQVKDYAVSGDYTPGAAVALYVTGAVFILPLAFLGLVEVDTQHSVDFEVSVRDLRTAPRVLVAEKGGDESTLRFDTRGIVPFFRQRYRAEMTSSRGWVKKELSLDDELPDHRRDVADQLATRMLNLALPDIRRAVAEALTRPPQILVAPPPEQADAGSEE